MALKSYAQQQLEHHYKGKDVKDIIIETLASLRGAKSLMAQAAITLRISEPTLRSWCRNLKINIDDYRQPAADIWS